MRVLVTLAAVSLGALEPPAVAGLADWEAAVGTGTAPAATYFKDSSGPAISGLYPMVFDVGPLSGDRTFEFIVFAGEAGLSSALMGASGVQALKFEQWNNTATLGLTDFGVADHLSPEPSPFLVETHLAYVFDGADTNLYVNGALRGTFAAIPLVLTGSVGIAGVSTGGPVFPDPLDGHVLGFASYDSALGAAEISAHAAAFANGSVPYFLSSWQAAVMEGTPALATRFTPVSGLDPVVVDVGDLAGLPSTFEFVVNAGIGGASGALLGRGGAGGQGLKFEQWNDSGMIGLTNFAVADLTSDVPAPTHAIAHVAYVSDGLSTRLFVDGELRFEFVDANLVGVPLTLSGLTALGAAATIVETQDGTVFGDVLDGTVLRFASYDALLDADEVAAHHTAFTADAGAGVFSQWLAAVGAGTPAVTTQVDPAAGGGQVVVDVGALTADRTFEFIVNAGDSTLSGSLLGDRVQALKFEQWNDTGMIGLTNYGVADHLSQVAPPLFTDTHIVFTSDGADTQLYIDGVLQHTFVGVPLTGAGMQGLAATATITTGGVSAAYFDRLDGHILGFASYAAALTADEISRHAGSLLDPGPPPAGGLKITAFARNPATGELSLTWTSTPGKTYAIHYSATLAAFNQTVATGIPAAGTSTSRTFPPPVPGAATLFFRVSEL